MKPFSRLVGLEEVNLGMTLDVLRVLFFFFHLFPGCVKNNSHKCKMNLFEKKKCKTGLSFSLVFFFLAILSGRNINVKRES